MIYELRHRTKTDRHLCGFEYFRAQEELLKQMTQELVLTGRMRVNWKKFAKKNKIKDMEESKRQRSRGKYTR